MRKVAGIQPDQIHVTYWKEDEVTVSWVTGEAQMGPKVRFAPLPVIISSAPRQIQPSGFHKNHRSSGSVLGPNVQPRGPLTINFNRKPCAEHRCG